jgi:hypothetical protein
MMRCRALRKVMHVFVDFARSIDYIFHKVRSWTHLEIEVVESSQLSTGQKWSKLGRSKLEKDLKLEL